MNAAVLVLDVGMRPLRVENWQRAICDLFLGKVEVLEYSKDRTIQGVSRAWPMPSVVRVLHNFKRDRIRVKFSRLNIYTRDGFKCQFCGVKFPSEELTFDHVIPRSRGGKTTWENIVTACGGPKGCNPRKGDRTPEEAGMKLIRKPAKPHWLPSICVKMPTSIPPEWQGYWSHDLEP
jgi:5-methylcytosine-specific restriction endonuclease McrA